MEVQNPRCTLLTNQEVLAALQQANKTSHPQSEALQQHKTVLYEGIKYLNGTPATHQTETQVKSLMKEMEKFKLTAAELLQIVNLQPRSLIDIEMIIEECGDRYPDEEATAEMLDVIKRHLPRVEKTKLAEEEKAEK